MELTQQEVMSHIYWSHGVGKKEPIGLLSLMETQGLTSSLSKESFWDPGWVSPWDLPFVLP